MIWRPLTATWTDDSPSYTSACPTATAGPGSIIALLDRQGEGLKPDGFPAVLPFAHGPEFRQRQLGPAAREGLVEQPGQILFTLLPECVVLGWHG